MYYSDKYSTIPYGIVNKRLTGCGMSSYALENPDNLVLVVPNISMIENKIAQYPNERRSETIFGLYSDISLADLVNYIESTNTPKIMVTFDSFWKLLPYIDKSYHIVVDEFQDLLDAYGYRSQAINSLLTHVFNFPKLSFISATPIKREYLPKALEDLPYTELEWDNTVPVTVVPTCTKKPLSAILNIITKYKLGLVEVKNHKSEAAYFYINSVTLIAQIVKKANLLPSEVRIVCAKTPENKKKLGKFYKIEASLDEEKMFNFFTSTCFKGSDIYSDSGISYIISNNSNINTLLTIDTDIYQIAGRIRNINNPFKGLIYHIFNENPLKMTEKDFTEFVDKKINITNDLLKVAKDLEGKGTERESLLSSLKLGDTFNYLYTPDGDSLEFDDILLSQERRVYECVIKPYQSGLHVINTYKEDEKYSVECDQNMFEKSGVFLMSTNFIDVCRLLHQGKGNLVEARKQFPLLDRAYPILGMKGLYKLGFNTFKINNALSAFDNSELIESEIKKTFTEGFYIPSDVKVTLQSIYDNLGVIKKAKATDIEKIFNIKPKSKKSNGKVIKGYLIREEE